VKRDGDLQMPPVAPLKAEEVAALAKWVEMGLPWPDKMVIKAEDAWRSHWAFQPVEQPPLPIAATPSTAPWSQTAIDSFVLDKLTAARSSAVPRSI
jgi:hypothetical protein